MTSRPVLTRVQYQERLERIFPRAAFDTVLSNPLAAAAVAAMVYVGAVVPDEGEVPADTYWVRPAMILWMNESLLARQDAVTRSRYHSAARVGRKSVVDLLAALGLPEESWYRDNSREPLRDETLQEWRSVGAVRDRHGLPTTSPVPRWALTEGFADLFLPSLQGDAFETAIKAWQDLHLSPGHRIRLGAHRDWERQAHAVQVTLPNRQVRDLEPGEASMILKGVIEEWAPARLAQPFVLTISEPGDKVYVADAARLRQLRLAIDTSNLLPDAVLVDIGATPPVFWIVEVAVSDGPVTEDRRQDLLQWASDQRIDPALCQFLSAFASRNNAAARKRLKDLAVGTFAWYADEPTSELAWYGID